MTKPIVKQFLQPFLSVPIIRLVILLNTRQCFSNTGYKIITFSESCRTPEPDDALQSRDQDGFLRMHAGGCGPRHVERADWRTVYERFLPQADRRTNSEPNYCVEMNKVNGCRETKQKGNLSNKIYVDIHTQTLPHHPLCGMKYQDNH